MNRDYFTKPLQGGSRESHDYGNTSLHRDEAPGLTRWVLGAFALAAIILGVLL